MEISYSRIGGYLLPDIMLNESPSEHTEPLGRYGRIRRAFLKEHRTAFYNTLLLSERLFPHLREVDEAASVQLDKIISDILVFNLPPDKATDGLENGLSVIENPKPSKGKDYGDWLGESKPPSARDKLEQIIDSALDGCKDFDSFIAAMKAAGCEVKRGKNLAFKIPDGQRFIRCKSLGADYTEDAIRERICGKRIVSPKLKTIAPAASRYKPNLLIDIQGKLQQATSPGFEHWARIYNLKESAKMLIFLQERGLTEYAKLVEKTESASKAFHVNNDRRKVIDNRLKEIAELQKHIGTYGKTREVYKQYLSLLLKKREDFFEAHRADITLHKAAKKHFDSLNLKKLPTITTLKQEYATLDTERRKLSQSYKAEREEMVSLLMAKQNVDRILGAILPPTKNIERDAR